ncbi:MAG: GPW/gp25 family protein [Phaeodactylibacter sp.]|nr:GPW/gp25 family protein [Phaeodactylibacter sp.]MCB9296406.1 GPW/gp25 family protein [Lewinellaceae bacterium]
MDDFTGKGWAFPPAFNRHTGAADMVKGEDDIRESIFILLSTTMGERPLLPEYGCDIDLLLFERLDATIKSMAKQIIETALTLHEPRIRILDIDVRENPNQEGVLDIHIQYVIKATNTRRNMVYPYYLEEGTQR